MVNFPRNPGSNYVRVMDQAAALRILYRHNDSKNKFPHIFKLLKFKNTVKIIR